MMLHDRRAPTAHSLRSARRRAPRAWLNRLVAFRAEHNRQGVCCRG